jgi:RNA polymerase sigma-70 factor (ECF subfamily)
MADSALSPACDAAKISPCQQTGGKARRSSDFPGSFMSDTTPSRFSILLADARRGSADAQEELIRLVYQDLRRLAQSHLKRERPGASLQATALVHEVYLWLFGEEQIAWHDRSHFLLIAWRQMRRILIDRARAAATAKRDGRVHDLPLEDVVWQSTLSDPDLIALDDALQDLEKLHSRACQVVELRFFGGLTEEETAEPLGISPSTAKREWKFARAWLHQQLRGQH